MALATPGITTVNPATGARLGSHAFWDAAELAGRIDAAARAQVDWAAQSLQSRSDLLRRIAAVLRERSEDLALTITREMGKPIVESRAEVEKCAITCEHYADRAARYLAPQPHPSDSPDSEVLFQPLGLVLAVMPWNFPLWQVFRFAAPALAAGNGGVLKHAANVTGSALAIEAAIEAAGVPRGVFTTLLVDHDQVENLIADRRIAAVTLTGSDVTGRHIAELAGRNLKKCVLELGGSDPFVVLADADLPEAVATAVRSRFQNAGQSCIAAKRFIVAQEVAGEFEQRLTAAVAELRMGDPEDPATQIGPMARGDLRDQLHQQVTESVALGARILAGGDFGAGTGWYYQPTVLTGVTPAMPVFREETFGPVATVTAAADEVEAVRLANQTRYGLGANIWTGDVARGRRLAEQIEAGGVFVNGMTHSDPRLPFGGIRDSGYGRELAEFGIREFVNIKTIWVGHNSEADGGIPAE